MSTDDEYIAVLLPSRFGTGLSRGETVMKATVTRRGIQGIYSAQTSNDIGVSFSVVDGTVLSPGDELDIDLIEVTRTKTIARLHDQRPIAIEIGENDLHDLRLLPAHGSSRVPSESRRRGES